MYPVLRNCRVRGTEDEYYLHQYLTGEEYELDSLQARILHNCTGEHEIQWLAGNFGQNQDEVLTFLQTLEAESLLGFAENQARADFAGLTPAPYLREVHIDATGWCNLYGKCKHCYGRRVFEEATSDQLTTEEMVGLIRELGRLNVANCVLSGGEVFIRRDLPLLISRLAEQCVHIAGIFTNGTIYREDVVAALQQESMKTRFLVSLDGHNPDIHDFMRGVGNFERTVAFIKKIKGMGFPVTVNTVAIKQNVQHLMEMCHFLEGLGISLWRIAVPREQGETVINKELILPDWDDVFRAYEALIRYAIVSTSGMRFQISSVFKTTLLEEPTYYLFQPESCCCEYKRHSITVKPNGNVTPCTAFDNLVLGNIRQTPLSDVWYSDLTQSFKQLPIKETKCQGCELLPYCGGGCRKVAWEIHGSSLEKDESACPLYRFTRDTVQPILKEHGIRAKMLDFPGPYRYDASLIDKAV